MVVGAAVGVDDGLDAVRAHQRSTHEMASTEEVQSFVVGVSTQIDRGCAEGIKDLSVKLNDGL